jgi:hypothetical protein
MKAPVGQNSLKLWGFFTHADAYKKLHFTYASELDSNGRPIYEDKIVPGQGCHGPHRPLDGLAPTARVPVGEYVCWEKLVTACNRAIAPEKKSSPNPYYQAGQEATHSDEEDGGAAQPLIIPRAKDAAPNTIEEILQPDPPKTVLPYTTGGFNVVFPPGMKKLSRIPDDIQRCVGCECTIYVQVKSTVFKSKLDENFGQEITNVSLVLEKIVRGIK